MSWEENPAVVLDNGSGLVKCGFAGEDQPRGVFSSVVARSLLRPQDAPLIGDDAIEAAAKPNSGLTLSYPLEHGIIEDYENMTSVWARMFQELKVDPSQYPVLLTEAPMNPNKNREKMAEIMFEKFNVPAINVQIQAVMSLYSCGRTDGVVVDSGDGVTHVVPVFEGYTIPTAVKRLDLAGRDLTEWMMELLNQEQKKRVFSTTTDREMAREIKEKACYVSMDFEKELEEYQENPDDESHLTALKLPDGSTFSVGKAKFCCPELLFSPDIAEKECRSLQVTVKDSVVACPIDCRRTLYNNIVCSGGSTMYKNYEDRLKQEVCNLLPSRGQDDVRVIAPGERKYSVWMGAAILASLTSFSQEWVTKNDWKEHGPTIVHQKCSTQGSFAGK